MAAQREPGDSQAAPGYDAYATAIAEVMAGQSLVAAASRHGLRERDLRERVARVREGQRDAAAALGDAIEGGLGGIPTRAEVLRSLRAAREQIQREMGYPVDLEPLEGDDVGAPVEPAPAERPAERQPETITREHLHRALQIPGNPEQRTPLVARADLVEAVGMLLLRSIGTQVSILEVAADKTWLREQSARELSDLYSCVSDRMFETLRAAERGMERTRIAQGMAPITVVRPADVPATAPPMRNPAVTVAPASASGGG